MTIGMCVILRPPLKQNLIATDGIIAFTLYPNVKADEAFPGIANSV